MTELPVPPSWSLEHRAAEYRVKHPKDVFPLGIETAVNIVLLEGKIEGIIKILAEEISKVYIALQSRPTI